MAARRSRIQEDTTTLDCGHAYHAKCIARWEEACLIGLREITCPLCRAPYRTDTDAEADTDEAEADTDEAEAGGTKACDGLRDLLRSACRFWSRYIWSRLTRKPDAHAVLSLSCRIFVYALLMSRPSRERLPICDLIRNEADVLLSALLLPLSAPTVPLLLWICTIPSPIRLAVGLSFSVTCVWQTSGGRYPSLLVRDDDMRVTDPGSECRHDLFKHQVGKVLKGGHCRPTALHPCQETHGCMKKIER